MTHVTALDSRKGSPTENMELSVPVTILEAPPLVVLGIRAYTRTTYGLKTLTDILATEELDDELSRKISLPKSKEVEAKIDALKEQIDDIADIRVLVHTKPSLTSLPKKKPEILEFAVGGKSVEEKLDYAVSVLGQEVQPKDTFQPGEHVDAIATTKGKGVQGPVKRFGVRIQYGKAARSSKERHVGSIGPWTPNRTMWTVAMAGQMGYHKRTEYNKKILKIGDSSEVEEINPDGGFIKYGLVKNNFFLVKGSLPGPSKRLVVLRKGIRSQSKQNTLPEISYISTTSRQGV
jgi:large subunit ribosomal protein L3